MKTQLLSTYLQTSKSVRSRSKAIENDSLVSNVMDLTEGNVSCNGNDDGGSEFDNGSSYNEGEALEAKQSSNVNSSPSQWPLRHNIDNESLEKHNSYSCNGFRQAKKPRYTYTGRISRIPSRYLDTDSDSGDGSVRSVKDSQNRLKVKRSRRRRKLPSSNSKLHVNGFKEHGAAMLLPVVEFQVDRITNNFGEQECLANVEYPDVFEDTSPISNDNISHVADETPDKDSLDQITSQGSEVMCEKASKPDAVNGEPTLVDNFCSRQSKQTAEHSFTSNGCCVDISGKNNGRRRFESLIKPEEESTPEINEHTHLNRSTTLVNTSFKGNYLHETSNCVSSMRQTVVSPKQISNDCQMSCTFHNGNAGSFIERQNCRYCKECTLNSPSVNISAENTQSGTESKEFELSGKVAGDIGSKSSKRKRIVKPCAKLDKTFILKDMLKDPDSAKADGSQCLKDLKMRKALAKKLKLRRNEKTVKNDVLKRNRRNGAICKVKKTSCAKVDVEVEENQTNKMNKKMGKLTKVKDSEASKSSEDLDRVLGMRRSPNGIYEFLVQWQNGTSCWVSSDDVVMDKHNYYLREYLVECEQDVSVVNRVPFQAYCCDSLSLKECTFAFSSQKALRKMLCSETDVNTVRKSQVGPTKQKHDVSVKYEESFCYITLNRETCKRKGTCLKIMSDLITALEDVATSQCDVVVMRGLGSGVLCGMKLDDMSKTGVEKDNVVLAKTRYFVQTLTNYPKLLVALISKSAEGIGAVILSLFDMICDEETWDQKQILDPCENSTKGENNVYTLPRLAGHSLPSEEILMGRNVVVSEPGESKSSLEPILANSSLEPSLTVTSTVMEIEATLRRFGKQTSFLQVNEAFPTIKSDFALFANMNRENSSVPAGDSCLGNTEDGSSVAVRDDSLSNNTIDVNADLNISDPNPVTVNSHPGTNLDEVDRGPPDPEISTNANCNENNDSDQRVQADADQTTKHMQRNIFTNANEDSRSDYVPVTVGQSEDNNTNIDNSTLNNTTGTVRDQAAPSEGEIEHEVHKILDITTLDKGIAESTKTTDASDLTESAPVDIINDHEAANKQDSIEDIQSQHDTSMKPKNISNQAHFSSSITECIGSDTSSINNLGDGGLNVASSMDSCEITCSEVNNTTRNISEAGSNEHDSSTDKDSFTTNIHNAAFGYAKTEHNGTGTMDNSQVVTMAERTSSECIHHDDIKDRIDVTSEKTITCGEFNSSEQVVGAESSVRDISGDSCDSTQSRLTEIHTNENNSLSNRKLSHESHDIELAKVEDLNNGARELTAVNSKVTNNTQHFTTNEVDTDITNYSNASDSFQLGTIPHAIPDAIPASPVEHTNASSTTYSATAAVDRYLRKLEAQLEEERRQAQRYIEEISRLCNNTILYES
ncbi:uncharacterized protein LOC114537486 [Dendronephthya gigantea]|uniref:uncharacterized protein LOC114537486 n=1 Tax=Dendronephthya gigantea TaxID=151771 RepID=UPI00106B6EAC|nr:uncharacterized protein LOC114537486 [Dendronephthya gigantea]